MVTTPRRPRSDTRTRILDVAERLVQTRGFNAFSYADIAAELDVSTASLHYHFAGKSELGRALIARYAERFNDVLAGIDARLVDPRARLEAYATIYTDLLQKGRFCLCGMLAAEYETLPVPMRDAVIEFFDRNEAWLIGVLESGGEQGALLLTGRPIDLARMIISGLEGAMLVTRPYGEVARFENAAVQLLASLVGTDRSHRVTGIANLKVQRLRRPKTPPAPSANPRTHQAPTSCSAAPAAPAPSHRTHATP